MKLKNDIEIKGCIHIHSTYSDGTETIPTIAELASQLQLDYIIMTDHMTLQPLKDGLEGWHAGVAVIIGYEINDSDDTHHYLALGLKEEVNKHLPARGYVKAVKQAGGIGIIAHPDEKRDQFVEHPPYPWVTWDIDDFDGIELWNHLSEWVEGLTPLNKLYRFIHPRKSILSAPKETIERWDRLNLNRPVFAIGGVDAHAHVYKLFGIIPLRIFHYKVQFKTIRTHLLLSEDLEKQERFDQVKHLILQAIRQGHSFIENYLLGDATGFRFWAETDDGIVEMGDTVYNIPENMVLRAVVPEKGLIRLIKNGTLVYQTENTKLEFQDTAPGGIYRIEVIKNERNWIYSNHIRLYKGNQNP
jgi:hypothetical protein